MARREEEKEGKGRKVNFINNSTQSRHLSHLSTPVHLEGSESQCRRTQSENPGLSAPLPSTEQNNQCTLAGTTISHVKINSSVLSVRPVCRFVLPLAYSLTQPRAIHPTIHTCIGSWDIIHKYFQQSTNKQVLRASIDLFIRSIFDRFNIVRAA